MASIYKEIVVDAGPDEVWAALRDFGALHQRLVPGFIVDSDLRGDVRVVTFADGSIVHERLVGVDDAVRRLAYTVVRSPLGATHHNASTQVIAEPDGRSRFVWVTDVLPDGLDVPIGGLMDQGLAVLQQTMERRVGRLAR